MVGTLAVFAGRPHLRSLSNDPNCNRARIELGSTLNYFDFAGYNQSMGRVPLISSCLAYFRPITTTSMLLVSMIRPFSSTSSQWPVQYGSRRVGPGSRPYVYLGTRSRVADRS